MRSANNIVMFSPEMVVNGLPFCVILNYLSLIYTIYTFLISSNAFTFRMFQHNRMPISKSKNNVLSILLIEKTGLNKRLF